MASQGPLFPGTLASALETGDDNSWVNPGNAGADDGAEAQVTEATFDANDQTAALRCSNFGFTVPDTAEIDGIVVEVEQREFAGSARDHQVQLFSSPGTLIGDNKATATAWPASATIATYGGSADPWGATLTPAIVNASGFGVQVKAFATAANTDVGIDFVRMTVHYTVAGETFQQTITASGVAVPSVARAMVYGKLLAMSGAAVATLVQALAFGVTMAATGVASAALTTASVIGLTLSSVGTAVVSLGAVFMEAVEYVARGVRPMMGWMGRHWRGMR